MSQSDKQKTPTPPMGIWDLGRILLSFIMSFTGAFLLSLLFLPLFGIKQSSPLLSKVIAYLPFGIFAIFLGKGLNFVFNRFRMKCTTEWDFWMIMLSFSLAGMFIMPVRKFIFHLVGITATTPLWFKILIYIPIIPPTYYFGLLVFGTLLGQRAFFLGMIAKRLQMLTGRKNIQH